MYIFLYILKSVSCKSRDIITVFRQAKLFKSKNYALFDECIRDAVATVTPNMLQAT
jgi:hypothetical protein